MVHRDEQIVAAPPAARLSGVLEYEVLTPAAQIQSWMTYIRIALLGALFIWLHWGLLEWLGLCWYGIDNWSHGFLMPLFSLYLLYCRWGELKALNPLDFAPAGRPAVWKTFLVVAAMLLTGLALAYGLHLSRRGLLGQMASWLVPVVVLATLWVRQYGQHVRWTRRLFYGMPCQAGILIAVLFLLAEMTILALYPNNWLLGLAMVGMLFGLTMYLNGLRAMRLLWLPILFLCLAIPIPGSQYNKLAYPLQELAAAYARSLLQWLGVEITRKASNLQLITVSGFMRELTVAEACSGMRLLMAFFSLGVATAYLGVRPLWQRVTLVIAAVPIAVVCNVLRVTITGYMHYIDRPDLGQGILHTATGMLMLIPAFAMLWGLGWLLEVPRWLANKLFVEELAEEAAAVEPVASADGEFPPRKEQAP
jgi:exosortase